MEVYHYKKYNVWKIIKGKLTRWEKGDYLTDKDGFEYNFKTEEEAKKFLERINKYKKSLSE